MIAGSRRSPSPDVTVIIPTRDRRERLATALASALAQGDVNIEVLVIDDGSRDGTSAMVEGFGDVRVRVLRNDVPLGESGARNRGLAAARGAWIAFLDDDDLWAPEKLSAQVRAMHETDREWAYAGDVVVDDELRVLYGAPPPPPHVVVASLTRHNSVPASASNVIAGADLLARAGPFDPGLRRTADWDMWLRLARIGPPAYVPRPLVAIRVHPGSMSRDMAAMFRELDVLAQRYGIPVDRARHCRWAAWEAMQAGRRAEALGYYARAVMAGDLRSIGRAAVAVLRPRSSDVRSETDAWTSEARPWVAGVSASQRVLSPVMETAGPRRPSGIAGDPRQPFP